MNEIKSSDSRKKCVFRSLMLLFLSVAVFSFAFSLLEVSRNCSRSAFCINNIKNIRLGLLNYVHVHGTLPPAWTTDEKGKRLHCWRVLLLPYLDNVDLYKKIRLDEPWDSEYNRQFHNITLEFLCCKNSKKCPGQCNYSVLLKENGLFPGAVSHLVVPEDDPEIIVVENPNSFCWMDPYSDISYEKAVQEANHMPDANCGHPFKNYVFSFGCVSVAEKKRYLWAIDYKGDCQKCLPGNQINFFLKKEIPKQQ